MVAGNTRTDGIMVRQARESDIPVLVDFLVKLAVHVGGGAPRTPKRKEKKRLRGLVASALAGDDKLMVVAEDSNAQLVGMGHIYIWRSQSIWEQFGDLELRSGIIDDIWVEPEYRGMGVFHAMLRELVSFAEDLEVGELILEYSLSNREAEATWSKLGFKPTGVRAAAFTSTVKKALSKAK